MDCSRRIPLNTKFLRRSRCILTYRLWPRVHYEREL
jgi:hypothetical protein